MKKTLMTFVAVGFGVSVAFAQTAPAETNQNIQAPTEQAAALTQAEQGERKKVEMSELPQEAQDAFANGQYSDLEVLAIYETSLAPENSKVYEFELAKAGEPSSEAAAASGEEMSGIEIEKVSERQPDIILYIDEQGEIVNEEKLDEEK